MKIEIGNNNKIKKSNIGSKVKIENRKNESVFIGIIITVVAGVILIAIEYFFDVIGIFS